MSRECLRHGMLPWPKGMAPTMNGDYTGPTLIQERRLAFARSAALGSLVLLAIVVALLVGAPSLWSGMLVAGFATLAGAWFGVPLAVAVLLPTALLLLILTSEGAISALGVLGLGLPLALLGRALGRRVEEAELREKEGALRTRLLTEAAMAMEKLDRPDTLYRAILRMLTEILDFTHAQVFAPRDGAMVLVASYRCEVPADFRLTMDSMVGEAARTRGYLYVPDISQHPAYVRASNSPTIRSELAIPLLLEQRVAAVLNIEHVNRDAFGPEEVRTLLAVGKMAEEALERARLQAQLVEMLEAIRNLAQSEDAGQLFEAAVESAIRLIPGAEGGSLMLFEEGEYRFVAAQGHDLAALKRISGVSYETQLKWYARTREEFLAGVPRLLTRGEIMHASMAGLDREEQRQTMKSLGRIAELEANICVPIIHRGSVLAVLNVDSFSSESPFGPRAMVLAETFAQQIAVIIRQTLYRDALKRAAVTDALTGLGNREGFNRQLNVELARARRYGQSFHLVMIDLDGFKSINDRFGHQAGDRVLVQAGATILRQRREGDTIFRWGGDEFALILPQIERKEALGVAERYVEALSKVGYGAARLAASFGIASYPEDGYEADELLRKADDLMYRHKSS